MRKVHISESLIQKISKESDKCIGCNLCKKNCPMLDEFCDTPKEMLKDMRDEREVDIIVPYSCARCNYCNQVCPKDVDLKSIFYNLKTHIVETEGTPPKELGYNTVKSHQNNSFSNIFSTDIVGLNSEQKNVIFFPGCSLSSYSPEIVEKTYEYLKEKSPRIGIALKCCGNPTYSMGEFDKFSVLYKSLQDDFEESGVEEVIVACQNCYKVIKENSPNIKVTSLWDFLSKHGVPKSKKNYYRSIDKVFSIHDPCPTRSESHIHDSIRDIVDQLGINVVEMKFIREKTLCCGSGAMLGVTNKKLSSQQREKRANQSDSDYIITYCEECVESMKKGGRKSIHILDLLFDDSIDKTFNQKDINVTNKWVNRYKIKRRILKYAKDK